MIWWLDTNTLMKKYVKRSEEEVQNTNFLLLSAKVNCTIPSENVLNVYNTFLCANTFKGVDFFAEAGSRGAVDGFSKFLLNSPTILDFICTVLQNDLDGLEDTVFVLAKEEAVSFGIETFLMAIEELFGYRIEKYPNISSCDNHDVLKRIMYYTKETEAVNFSRMPEKEMLETIGNMEKKQLKKIARQIPQYVDGMGRKEMEELVLTTLQERRDTRRDWNRDFDRWKQHS